MNEGITSVWRLVFTAGVWLSAAIVGSALSWIRFEDALAATQPDFEYIFMPAARAVAAGGSPYQVTGYFYSPLLAMLLVPMIQTPWAIELWTVVRIFAGLTAVPLAVWAIAPRLRSWQRGILCAVAVVTLFYSWPMTFELWLGLPDLLVVLSLAATAFFETRGRRVLTGLSLGMTAAVKTWPAAFGLWLLRAGARSRSREWLGVALVAVFCVASALALGGSRAVADMVSAPFRASDQPLAAFSVWGAPKLLFSHTPVAEPWLDSPGLRVASTAVLVVWVLALGLLGMRRTVDPVLSLYHLVFVTVLLLPVSHYVYLLFPLPVLWWWVARVIAHPSSRRAWIVSATMVGWWLLAFRVAPSGDGVSSVTWPSFLLIFASNLIAATVSIVAAVGVRPPVSRGV